MIMFSLTTQLPGKRRGVGLDLANLKVAGGDCEKKVTALRDSRLFQTMTVP